MATRSGEDGRGGCSTPRAGGDAALICSGDVTAPTGWPPVTKPVRAAGLGAPVPPGRAGWFSAPPYTSHRFLTGTEPRVGGVQDNYPGGSMNRARVWIVTAAAAAGAMIGAAGIAAAAGNSQATQTPSSSPSAGQQAGPGGADPATVAHGPGETLLTGTTAAKVRAAALAAVPG